MVVVEASISELIDRMAAGIMLGEGYLPRLAWPFLRSTRLTYLSNRFDLPSS